MYKIILASGSPRRREIFEQVGVQFSVITSKIEEITTKNNPEEIVLELATIKAEDVAEHVDEPAIIIGSDTMVALEGQVMGKPKDEDDAKNMIRKIQGAKHQVHTGVSIIFKDIPILNTDNISDQQPTIINKVMSFVESTDVWVNPMTEEQIAAYIATGEPFDKAGAYAIQGKFAVHINRIDGDYYNIVGFPISRLYQTLLKEGINILL